MGGKFSLVGLTGEIGSGKTTMARELCAHYDNARAIFAYH